MSYHCADNLIILIELKTNQLIYEYISDKYMRFDYNANKTVCFILSTFKSVITTSNLIYKYLL